MRSAYGELRWSRAQNAPMSLPIQPRRHIGLFGATSIGVGAIVGGGILALAGTAFETTGPGALLAFLLNGIIAALTALSFAELATAFPQSGGPYEFSKRLLTVDLAFGVGWIVWFASIVAAMLYALGFGAFSISALDAIVRESGGTPMEWLAHPLTLVASAVLVTGACALVVARSANSGGQLMSIAKVLVFMILIVAGLFVWWEQPARVASSREAILPEGFGGLLKAMGFTFIALQGFDLIAAVAGEVKDPRRTLPRAMFLSLGIAIAVYIPLLTVVMLVGVPEGMGVREFAAANPETIIATAARNYLGPSGFWLVIVAGLLSMVSALLANLFGASRIAQAMARDRTLPFQLQRVHSKFGTPFIAVLVTSTVVVLILVAVGDVAAAGAASSLIFLVAFALTHVLCIVARLRKPGHSGFRVPLWPYTPIVGAATCFGLAIFQGIIVPSAGLVGGVWLLIGVLCYVRVFAGSARRQDAIHEVIDADLLELRGRSPLVLVPTANAKNADVLALLAACLSPPRTGRVLLLNVVPPLQKELTKEFADFLDQSSILLRDSLSASVHAGARTEALATVAQDPWDEMERVAREHRCATILIGMTHLSDAALRGRIDLLASRLTCNVVIARIPPEWRPEGVGRALVPIRGSRVHNSLRARLLTSLRHRAAPQIQVVYLLVHSTDTTPRQRKRREQSYAELVRDEVSTPSIIKSIVGDDVGEAITAEACDSDLLILGLSRVSRGKRTVGEATRKIVASTSCAVFVIGDRS